MSKTKDYIPGPDAGFDGWLANLAAYVERKTAAGGWTHIPAAKTADLKQHNADWHGAYAKTLGPHTSVDTEDKNDKRKAAEAFARPFVAQYLKFDPVTNEDRTAMNLHNKDDSRTAVGKPDTRALIADLKALGGFRVLIAFQNEATPDSRAVPYGCNGALLNFTWGPEKKTGYADLTQSRLMTHSPFTLELPTEAEGKFFSGAARWQSKRGELGPWGEIEHIAVS